MHPNNKKNAMKTTILITAIALLSCTITFSSEIKTDSDIKDVTVFLKGAQIEREAYVNLKSGTNEIVFTGLSPYVDANTIQAKGKGNFTILSVNYRKNYLVKEKKSKRTIVLEDSLELLQEEIDELTGLQNVYHQEQSMLTANKSIGGTQTGVNILDLQKATEFFRERMKDINKKLLSLKMDLKVLHEEKSKIANQLQEEKERKRGPAGEVVVAVSSKTAQRAKLLLDYSVSNAGWIPYYDLRAKDVNSPVELNFKAKVYQTTGAEWENVNLTLSTAEPSKSGIKPSLNTWYVSLYEPYSSSGGRYKKSKAMPMAAAETYSTRVKKDAETMSDYTQVVNKQTNFEYQVNIPSSVKPDGKKVRVNITDHTLNANYKYYCVPKLDTDAFLMAEVTGWSEYNLLPGNINLFFEGTYTGKSYMDVNNANDTLPISLGRDKGIIVKREKIKDIESSTTIGLNQKETQGWKITVFNNKRQPIEIVIEDQLPVANNKDIKIEPIELSNAKHIEYSGMLEWELKIKPRETKKIKLKYSIKYPKNKNLRK